MWLLHACLALPIATPGVLYVPILSVLGTRARSLRCCEEQGDAYSEEDRWRLARIRLAEQYAASVRRRRPRFLDFISARQWARAMFFTSEEDWREWIDAGEKRNPYIPSNPDEIYADDGWISWIDFLNGDVEPDSVTSQEQYRRGKWLFGPLSDQSGEE